MSRRRSTAWQNVGTGFFGHSPFSVSTIQLARDSFSGLPGPDQNPRRGPRKYLIAAPRDGLFLKYEKWSGYMYSYGDYNNDGLVDFIKRSNTLMVNNGNFTFISKYNISHFYSFLYTCCPFHMHIFHHFFRSFSYHYYLMF